MQQPVETRCVVATNKIDGVVGRGQNPMLIVSQKASKGLTKGWKGKCNGIFVFGCVQPDSLEKLRALVETFAHIRERP